MTAYYNEIDPYAADWLENLIAIGAIAPGVVDRRSIEDVRPDELIGFTQCHFFAGIGIWSRALRDAGWPDDRPVWTGSEPCQPYSAAGKGAKSADERYLRPAFHHLIQHGKPGGVPVFGEQVASKDGLEWLDTICADMENAGHTFWAVDLCAAGIGAPHIRQRLYWVAYANGYGIEGVPLGDAFDAGLEGHSRDGDPGFESGRIDTGTPRPAAASGPDGALDNAASPRCDRSVTSSEGNTRDETRLCMPDQASGAFPLANPSDGLLPVAAAAPEGRDGPGPTGAFHHGDTERPGPVNGFWRNPDWLLCRDGKWRPVEPGTFPLVDGHSFDLGPGGTAFDPSAPFAGKSRAGMLKGYGNAINKILAQTFIESVMGVL